MFSKTAVSNLLLILQRPATHSHEIAAQLTDYGIFDAVSPLLPQSENQEQDTSIIQDTLSLCQELVGSATISKAKEFQECAQVK